MHAGNHPVNWFFEKPDITLLTSHFAVSRKSKNKTEHCEFASCLGLNLACFACPAFHFFKEVCANTDVEIEAAIMSNLM